MVKDLKFNLVGKIIVAVSIIAAIVFCVFLCLNSLVPLKFKIIICAVLGVLFGAFMFCQFTRPKVLRIIIMAVSVLLAIALGFGTYYLIRIQSTLNSVTSNIIYKTDNMIVVTRSDSGLRSITEAQDCVFGIQTTADLENTTKMIAHIEKEFGTALNVRRYQSIHELVTALLNREVQAIIYNEAFDPIIADLFPEYKQDVKTLYKYGFEIEIVVPKPDADEDNKGDDGDKTPSKPKDTFVTTNPFCVYVSGIDVDGPISMTSRSDVNIIMAVNPITKKILLVTTPRDYYVKIPGISGEMRDKLTHAGIYGVDASMKTLSALYNVDISYYLRVNFTSLLTVVDALGGVDVHSDYEFYTTYEHYHIKKGMNHLNGDQALCFCRDRYSFPDGDNQRGKNQQAVLEGILKKAMSPAILLRANELLNAVGGSMETNMSPEEIGSLVEMQLSDMASWEFESMAATGSSDINTCFSLGSYQVYVMWPNEKSLNDISAKLQEVLAK